MDTKQLTRGAMTCAIYGALLFLNQQTGMAIETGASWIFIFPILIYTSMYGMKVSSIVAVSMALMTFLFGSFTTWFYSWFSIISGFIYGIGIYHKQKNITNFILLFIVSFISNFLMIYIWAGIFGMDMTEDFMFIHQYLPQIRLEAFMFVVVVLLALLESLCVHLLSLMICIRLHIDIHPIQPITRIKSPRWVGVVSIIIWIIFIFSQNRVLLNDDFTNIVQVLWILDCALLDFYGVVYFMSIVSIHQQRKRAPFAILGAFIPLLQLVWMMSGELDCLLQIRRDYLYKKESL